MNRTFRVFGWLALLAISFALACRGAGAQPAFSNVTVTCVTNGANAIGTDNSTYIFHANIDPGANNVLVNLQGRTYLVGIVLTGGPNPVPEGGPYPANNDPYLRMQRGGDGANSWIAFVPGWYMVNYTFSRQPYWSIVARNNTNGGVFQDGTGASPKPAVNTVIIYPPQGIELMPVDQNFQPDKRTIPGQPGNGLRIDPADPTSPNDGGAATIYTWRVRFRNAPIGGSSALPPEFFFQRPVYEWRDTRSAYDAQPPLVRRQNSGVVLVLIDPQGNKHYCPMEIDPDAPGQAGLYGTTYGVDGNHGGSPFSDDGGLFAITGGDIWNSGVFYRYRMLPSQYIFNHGPLVGEGPFTAFGGPTQPDSLPAIPIGYGAGADGEFTPSEVLARPYMNEYTSFAGPDRTTYQPLVQAPQFPLYTDVLNRAGQWKYYYMTTTDFRPPQRNGFPANFNWPSDHYGYDPDAYLYVYDSDTGLNPGDPSLPYIHPLVTPMLSDGGWTDDLPENGWQQPAGNSRNAHRSRVTTGTRVRFMVRASQGDNNGPPLLVRVFIDGTDAAHAHAMQPLPVAGNNDYTQGVIYYYDTNFASGLEGRHWSFFEADDGVHKAIWPRRDTPANGTGDGRYPDLQATVAMAGAGIGTHPDSVNFGTGTVGWNYLDEPFVNHRPVLLTPSVSPPSGVEQQPFTYEVSYYDADNDEPLDAWVVVDDIEHRMTAVDGTPVNTTNGGQPVGRRYRFVLTSLAATISKQHKYYFKFRDNWNNPATLQRYNISNIRREYGEWVTIPQGDENGNPSSQINGPTITGNLPPELFDPQWFGSDAAQTPATQFDFLVRYRDQDNEAPATLKLYLSADAGASWDTGTALVKAENSNNYVAGVQYHLPTRVRLPLPSAPDGHYRYKFIANDGTNDATAVRVGTGLSAAADGSAHILNGAQPDPTRDFQDLVGPATDLQPTRGWVVTSGADIDVWQVNKTTGATTPLQFGVDYAVLPTDDGIQLASPLSAGYELKASYFYTQTTGPKVNPNRAPVLSTPVAVPPGDPTTNNGTLTPLTGDVTSTFTYDVVYTDADNQAPIDSQGNTDSIDLYVDAKPFAKLKPKTSPPFDYSRGVTYTGTATGTALGTGQHNYHFETSDGADTARLPLATDQSTELSGPRVIDSGALKVPPTPAFPNDVDIRPFPKGKHNDQYTFSIVYQSQNGVAPPANTTIAVGIKDNTAGTYTYVDMSAASAIDYQNGTLYQVQLTAPTAPLTVGSHDITFGFRDSNGFAAATTPKTLIVNAQPTLTVSSDPAKPLISSNPASPANQQVSVSQAGSLDFYAVYTDANGDPPAPINLIITPNGGTPMTLPPTDSAPASPVAADYIAGVTYHWHILGSQFTVSTFPAQFGFYIMSNDGTEASVPPQITDNFGQFTITQAAKPALAGTAAGPPSVNSGTLVNKTFPARTPNGAQSDQFTYSVTYSHPDGAPPVLAQLIIDPGANQTVADMTPPANPDYKAGAVFTYSTQPNTLTPGQHTYRFHFTDALATVDATHIVELPATGSAAFSGPTINNPPKLASGTAYIQGTTPGGVDQNNALNPAVSANPVSNVIFRVSYSDPDGIAPTADGYIRVKVDGGTVYAMHAVDANPNYAGGAAVVYESNPVTGAALGGGQHTFHFEASDGFDPTLLPATGDISGLFVAGLPVLTAPTGGTLTPSSGPESTTFTYDVVYTQTDGSPAQTVTVFIDGQPHAMKTVAAGDPKTGVTYEFQYRFPSGSSASHVYRFEAVDSQAANASYTAHLPNTQTGGNWDNLTGPTINVAEFGAPTFNPAKPIVGAALTITSTLVSANPGNQPIAVQLVKADGTGFNANANTDANGVVTVNLTANQIDQTGDWKVKFSWAGLNGVYDPVTKEFPFKVSGASLALNSGEVDMIAQPLIPVTPDPSTTFGVTAPDGTTSLPVTTLDLIVWSPITGASGLYLILNQDASFPGITGGASYWVKPSAAAVINPRGKLWDQTAQYSVPLAVGWNMVGSVYMQDINWGAVKVRYQGQVLDLASASNVVRPIAWTYDKASHGYVMVDATDPLKTWRGYWVRAFQPCELLLSPPGARAAIVTRAAVDLATSLQIEARSGGVADPGTYAPLTGVTASRLALMEKPPYLGDYVSVKLLSSDSVTLPADTRAAVAGQTVIGFQVETNRKNADVSVAFPNAGTLGRKYEMTLVDLANSTQRDVGTGGAITYNTGDNAAPRRFAVLVSSRTINNTLAISDLRATGRAAGALNFTFTLSASAAVQAEVLNGTGAVIRQLAQGRAATRGVNNLQWDGKSGQGIAVPAGPYVLKITATDDRGRTVNRVLPVLLTR